MWFGILFIPSNEPRGDQYEPGGDLAIVHVYQRDRLFTVGGAPDALPQMLSVLRLAAHASDQQADPRCRSCDFALDVPDLDNFDDLEAACGSA